MAQKISKYSYLLLFIKNPILDFTSYFDRTDSCIIAINMIKIKRPFYLLEIRYSEQNDIIKKNLSRNLVKLQIKKHDMAVNCLTSKLLNHFLH